MPFWKWSKTADNNQTADTSVNWQEGQLPSTVNNSARAMMARLAEWRDDISGVLTTGGSATAYTISTNQGFDSFVNMDRAMLCFVPHVTNSAASPTLNVDGLGAKPLRWATSLDVQSNSLIGGTPYCATYFSATNEWILCGAGSAPVGVPLGAGMDFWGMTPPSSAFAFPIGQAISRTAYSSLYALYGTTYGAGDGTSTFNLPNKLGKISAALDSMGGSASAGLLNSIASTTLGATGGAQTFTLGQSQLPNYTLTGGIGSVTVSGATGDASNDHVHGFSATTGGQSASHTHAMTTSNAFLAAGTGAAFSALGNAAGSVNLGTTSAASNDHTHNVSGATGGMSAGHTHLLSASGSATSISINSGGSGAAVNKLPPVILCNYIIRII